MEEKKRKDRGYKVMLLNQDGVTCISVLHTKHHYSVHGDKEPRSNTIKEYKDKKQKRGVILKKLGIWENGQNLEHQKKQE